MRNLQDGNQQLTELDYCQGPPPHSCAKCGRWRAVVLTGCNVPVCLGCESYEDECRCRPLAIKAATTQKGGISKMICLNCDKAFREHKECPACGGVAFMCDSCADYGVVCPTPDGGYYEPSGVARPGISRATSILMTVFVVLLLSGCVLGGLAYRQVSQRLSSLTAQQSVQNPQAQPPEHVVVTVENRTGAKVRTHIERALPDYADGGNADNRMVKPQ